MSNLPQSLGGSLFTDPTQNQAALNAGNQQDMFYAQNHSGHMPDGSMLPGWSPYSNVHTPMVIGPGPGNQAVSPQQWAHDNPDPYASWFGGGAPTQPANINTNLIISMLKQNQPSAATASTAPATYASNINASPIWSPQAQALAAANIGQGGTGNVPLPPGLGAATSNPDLNFQAATSSAGPASNASLAFNRGASADNAAFQLQSQRARAQQGGALAQFLAMIQGQNFGNQQRQNQLLMTLMGSLGGMGGIG